MEQRAKDLISQGDRLFGKKENLDSLWQEIALNFYPERADFTDERTEGEEYADHLYSSFPVIARRELANMVATSLRPRSTKWFSIHVEEETLNENDNVRAFLEYVSNLQWRTMYSPRANLIRATKQADHDFVAFGNAVLQISMNLDGSGLLYRNYHLRDCAWAENAEGSVDAMHRKWKATAKKLYETFPNKISSDVKQAYNKDPYKEFTCRHIVVPSEMYKGKAKEGFPYVSIYVEQDSETVLEEIPLRVFPYVVPRWHTVDCSQYGSSMATSVCLPDGRTQQVIARTMLEAGEKYVDPPQLAYSDAIRGDIALYAGGITIVDQDYDERTGEVLRPVSQNASAYPISETLTSIMREDISNGFFLNKIQLPDSPGDMTAYETRQRIQEYIRAASPIFEPIEHEYSDPLCEKSFEIMLQNGMMPVDDMPDELQEAGIKFSFRSPMSDMAEQQDAEIFVDAFTRILAPASEADPAQFNQVNWDVAVRDAMKATGFKQKWFNPIEVIDQIRKAQQEARAQQEMLATQGLQGEAKTAQANAQQAMNDANR